MVYGPRVPFARARRVLPILDQWADMVYPQGSTADVIIDYRVGLGAKFKEIGAAHMKRVLQDKLINPEFAFLTRADMGLFYLLRKLRAKVNFSEVWRRVASTSAAESHSTS
jgi:hypothetical protein